MTDSQKEKSREWLLEELDKRVEAVVGGSHRHSYYKAAVLIIVMGEVLEEAGEENAVDRLIAKYTKLHSRKRAFRAEIQELRESVE